MKNLAMLIIPLLLFIPIVAHSSSLTVYYNGTVIANVDSGIFYFVGNNITSLKVIGGNYTIKGNVIYFNSNNVTLFYKANFSGVIKIDEPYNLSVNVLLPSTSSITYISPAPQSFKVSNGLFNFTFYSSSVVILYTSQVTSGVSKTGGNAENIDTLAIVLLVIGLGITNSILGYVVYSLKKERSKRKEEEEGEEKEETITQAELNDRDLAVLNAIKAGASTLSEIMKATNLPKTTTYRRVKKLVSLGYVQEIRKNGKIYYVYAKKD